MIFFFSIIFKKPKYSSVFFLKKLNITKLLVHCRFRASVWWYSNSANIEASEYMNNSAICEQTIMELNRSLMELAIFLQK